MKDIAIVRYKKDLRILDHQPLLQAQKKHETVVGIYCFEPCTIQQHDYSPFHHQFIHECLIDLRDSLKQYHIPLFVYDSSIEHALSRWYDHYHVTSVYSHQETGNWTSYQRDIALNKWCKKNGFSWQQFPTNGVVRGLSDRNLRHGIWQQRMEQFVSGQLPRVQKRHHRSSSVSEGSMLLTKKRPYGHLQSGGEKQGWKTLRSFFEKRYRHYLYDIGKAHASTTSCSRLSPYLTYGCLSIYHVYYAALEKSDQIRTWQSVHQKKSPAYQYYGSLLRQVRAFMGRLHWHCHFVQKLESDPRYEFDNIHPYYDRIRHEHNEDRLERRKQGQTGFPLIDAAMRCLQQTGWINFRLRATLVSFICNTCLQDWREPALHLAKLFTDYEPGIHYTQFQMQAGTTGINQYRIYNPTKQAIEKDPEGIFIKKRIPELKDFNNEYIAEPRKSSGSLFAHPVNYPIPMLDLASCNKKAKTVLRDLKKSPGFRTLAQKIYEKHGSRKKR